MKVFVGGVAAVFLGIISMIVFHRAFFDLIAGAIPLVLLLGGAMAAYLGYDEVKEKLPFPKNKESREPEASSETKLKEEAERYKQEVERLKAELDKSKSA